MSIKHLIIGKEFNLGRTSDKKAQIEPAQAAFKFLLKDERKVGLTI